MKFKLVETLDNRPRYLAEDSKIDLNKVEIVGYINNEGILVLPPEENDEDWEDWNGRLFSKIILKNLNLDQSSI